MSIMTNDYDARRTKMVRIAARCTWVLIADLCLLQFASDKLLDKNPQLTLTISTNIE